MPNRLTTETSPYLLQHANNPVDWYPWGPEALERARREDKPILLSIGYSACHWCHVMEHESFENPATATIMNENFVNIKVDREERPDLDSIYMAAVQAMTGHGGWPMTVFLSPDGTPFYGGTYFPPEPRHGMPSFPQLLEAIANAYRTQRDQIEQNAAQMRAAIQPMVGSQQSGMDLGPRLLESAYRALARGFDWANGGFGSAPKFPQPMSLELMLRYHHRSGEAQALTIVERSLEKMARGGIYDQIGGGFARYSVDAVWLVPHFEKMLYDNAQLARIYLDTYLVTGKDLYRRICEETLDFVIREMTAPTGGFYSTQDADSEGHEGKFYVWTPEEIVDVLGSEDGRILMAFFGVSEGGNFEGKNILNVPRDLEAVAINLGLEPEVVADSVERARPRLYEVRERRVHPGRDEKILTSWNGLMLRAFAEAARALGREDYRQVAVANAEFVLANLYRDGRLLRTHKDGMSKLNGYLEDYANYADGLLALYETTADRRWLETARVLADSIVTHFADEENGGFFDTSDDHETLVARPKDLFDNATPAGNSVAAEVLQKLAVIYGDPELGRRGVSLINLLHDALTKHPSAFGRLLCAADFAIGPVREIAVVGPSESLETRALRKVFERSYLPNRVVVFGNQAVPSDSIATLPLLADRVPIDGRPTAYVCEQYTCLLPVTEPAALAGQLGVKTPP